MKIIRYVLVDTDDNEQDYEYDEHEYDEAEAEAYRTGCAVIARVFEYEDSELVWTPNGSNIWPPKKRTK